MSANPGLSEADFRSLVRLLGQVCLLEQPRPRRREILLDGLCGLIGAQRWQLRTGTKPALPAAKSRGAGPTALAPIVRRPRPWVPANGHRLAPQPIGARLLSLRFTDDSHWSCLRFIRIGPRAATFTERDANIVRLVTQQIPWVHEPRPESPALAAHLASLPQRLQKVSMLVEMGLTRQQIAEGLELSPYTVRDYLSELYDHFSVRSQPELVRAMRSVSGSPLPVGSSAISPERNDRIPSGRHES